MSSLADLSKTYLEFIDDIRAGERALADDISRTLAACAEAVGEGTKATATTMERIWTPARAGGTVRLHLAWQAHDGWPVLRFESDGGAGLITTSLMKQVELPAPDRTALTHDPVSELTRCWNAANSSIGEWLGNTDVATRFVAVSVLTEVSRRLRDALRPAPASFNQAAGKVGGTEGNTHWPAYVQWNDRDAASGKSLGWVLVYHPNASGNRPAGLQLVYYNGAGVLPLVGITDAPIYVNHPILSTWTDRLAAAVDETESVDTVAEDIVRDITKMYAAYRKRLDGQTG